MRQRKWEAVGAIGGNVKGRMGLGGVRWSYVGVRSSSAERQETLTHRVLT